jgi:hypothetical protein
VFCIKCGHRLQRGALYCSACGRKQAGRLKYMDITPRANVEFFEVQPASLPAVNLTSPIAAAADAFTAPAINLPDEFVPAAEPKPAKPWTATPGYLEALRAEGAIASFIVAGATGVMGGLAAAGYVIPGVSPWSLIDAVAFLVLGYAVIRGSRIAGVTAFALFLAESVTVYAATNIQAQAATAFSVIVRALLIRSFYRGMRGTVQPTARKRFYLLTAAAVVIGIAAGFGLSFVR